MKQHITRTIFNMFKNFIGEKTGMSLPQTSYGFVMDFIARRITKLNIKYQEYLYLLKSDKDECTRFINAIMIGETYFVRVEKHFQILKDYILPQYKNKRKIILWSATCSTGEEAISIAVIVHKFLYESYGVDYSIIASDINTEALNTFKEGKYNQYSLKKSTSQYIGLIKKYYHNGKIELPTEIKSRIYIKHINLFSDDTHFINADVVFFRNTLIYCDIDAKEIMINNITNGMAKDGYLFVAPCEVPFVFSNKLKIISIKNTYFFQKK